jgi:hypothetical protein
MRPIHLLRAIPAAALLTASLSIAASAQAAAVADAPTQAAITALRTSAAALIAANSPGPSWAKGITSSQLSAAYDNQLTDQSSSRMNTVMVVKTRAEKAAWTTMDPTSRALIKNYFAAGR